MLFIDNRRLMEPEELPINCASCAWNKIDTRLNSMKSSPEQARAKVYFNEQQMRRQIVSKDTTEKHYFEYPWWDTTTVRFHFSESPSLVL